MSPQIAVILAAAEQFGATVTEIDVARDWHFTYDSTCSFGSHPEARPRRWRVEWPLKADPAATWRKLPTGPDMAEFFQAVGCADPWDRPTGLPEQRLVSVVVYDSDFVASNGREFGTKGVVLATTARYCSHAYSGWNTGRSPHIVQNERRQMRTGMFC